MVFADKKKVSTLFVQKFSFRSSIYAWKFKN